MVYAGVVKRLIYEFKFAPYVSDLAGVLGELFWEGLIQREEFQISNGKQNKVVLVPVPLHGSRLRERGYNQAELLAKELDSRLSGNDKRGVEQIKDEVEVWNCLERVRKTRRQVGLAAVERRENMRGAFELKRGFEEKLKEVSEVFLVDDIVTSGATLLEAGRVLKKAGVERVWGLALAHGE